MKEPFRQCELFPLAHTNQSIGARRDKTREILIFFCASPKLKCRAACAPNHFFSFVSTIWFWFFSLLFSWVWLMNMIVSRVFHFLLLHHRFLGRRAVDQFFLPFFFHPLLLRRLLPLFLLVVHFISAFFRFSFRHFSLIACGCRRVGVTYYYATWINVYVAMCAHNDNRMRLVELPFECSTTTTTTMTTLKCHVVFQCIARTNIRIVNDLSFVHLVWRSRAHTFDSVWNAIKFEWNMRVRACARTNHTIILLLFRIGFVQDRHIRFFCDGGDNDETKWKMSLAGVNRCNKYTVNYDRYAIAHRVEKTKNDDNDCEEKKKHRKMCSLADRPSVAQ